MGKWGILDKSEREEEDQTVELAAKKRCSGGRGFVGEPRRTLYSELRGNDTIIPNEAWAIHGELEEELDMGYPQEEKIQMSNVCEEDIYPDREEGENYSIVDEDPADIPDKEKVEAAANLIEMLGIGINCSREVCDVVGVYLNGRMDGIVKFYFQNIRKPTVITAILNFISLLRDKLQEFKNGEEAEFDPLTKSSVDDIIGEAKAECFRGLLKIRELVRNAAISSEAKSKLIGKAQRERQEVLKRHLDALPSTAYATLLGVAIFGRDKFSRLLRATV